MAYHRVNRAHVDDVELTVEVGETAVDVVEFKRAFGGESSIALGARSTATTRACRNSNAIAIAPQQISSSPTAKTSSVRSRCLCRSLGGSSRV
jgi:hypothetical protein